MTARVVEGVPPWDGSYDIPDWFFTNRELYDIKKVSGGIRAGELLEALDANDTAAFVAVAVVVLARHGKVVDPDDLWDAKVGAVSIVLGDEGDGDVEVPPSVPPVGGDPSDSSVSSGVGSGSSGEA